VDTTVEEGMMITVERSSQVTITIGDTQIETRASGATVADALSAGEIILNGLDYTIPPENTRLTPDMNVRVVRVTEEVLAETEPLPYEVIYQADAELELDQQAVIQTGVEGVQQHNIRVRYEDGVEVSRTDEGLSVTQEPVDQIIAYGTNVVLRTIDTAEGPREYWRKLRLYATSYYPKALGGDNVTATGMTLQKGVVAIDPKLIPYDTQMYIPDYGIGIAGDTGGPRLSRYWIDLGYSDADWVHWARWTDVYLLTPVPPDIQYLLPAVQTPQ
jgi:3D (Asp-Asp-Asp) domain-containing protein